MFVWRNDEFTAWTEMQNTDYFSGTYIVLKMIKNQLCLTLDLLANELVDLFPSAKVQSAWHIAEIANLFELICRNLSYAVRTQQLSDLSDG